MSKNSQNIPHSRRGFFRSLLGDIVPKPTNTEENRQLRQRASVLALKYGKNEARLAKIGVKTPVAVDESVFRVELTGTDDTGDVHHLEVVVNSATGTVNRLEADPAPTGNTNS